MDSSFTIKPNTAVPKFTARERQPSHDPVATELDSVKSVASIGDGHEERERPHDHLPHDVVADPESREVINRENDIRAHEAEREHPDQALLRLRAYRPATASPEHPAPDEPHANIKA
jgi:hypothetical protein